MAKLRVFDATNAELKREILDHSEIAEELSKVGIKYEEWHPETDIHHDASPDEVLKAFDGSIKKLMSERGFKSCDVMALTPDHPQKKEFRQKFLSEHIHTDDEARYFVDGSGLFYVHFDREVLGILCEKGDLINVPKGTKHWFDMGEHPDFKCIRVFTDEKGWVADFTGDNIAAKFPLKS